MPYLQLDGQQVALAVGDTLVGVGADGRLRLGDSGVQCLLAVVRTETNAMSVVLRGGSDSVVRVNGVLLGAEPSPLIHGDRLEIGRRELRYGDDLKAADSAAEHEVRPTPVRVAVAAGSSVAVAPVAAGRNPVPPTRVPVTAGREGSRSRPPERPATRPAPRGAPRQGSRLPAALPVAAGVVALAAAGVGVYLFMKNR